MIVRPRSARGSLLCAAAGVLTVGVAVSNAAPSAYSRPGTTELVSKSSSGAQAHAGPATNGDHAGYGLVSADGRYVAFTSNADNLVPRDLNQQMDVFRRDRQTGKTMLISVASDGTQAIPLPTGPGVNLRGMSANGRYIAFDSSAPNLVPGDTNLTYDVFVHDTLSGKTTRVSVASNGAQANKGGGLAAISADGRYAAFESDADNLVPGDTNGSADVFVHDLQTHKTIRASLSSQGLQGNGGSFRPTLSANGRYIAFESGASNLVPGDTSRETCKCDTTNVFWRDLKTGQTKRVSVASDGTQTAYAGIPTCVVGAGKALPIPSVDTTIDFVVRGITVCFSRLAQANMPGGGISADGRFVTFASNATNLVPNDNNFKGIADGWDTFVHDVWTGRTERTSVNSYGVENASTQTESSVISPDGRFVAQVTWGMQSAIACSGNIPRTITDAAELACNGQEMTSNVYDRLSGEDVTLMRSMSGGTPKSGPCSGAEHSRGLSSSQTVASAITPGGRYVVLLSSATDLAPGDTNGACDTFVRDRGPAVGFGGLAGSPAAAPAPGCGLPVCPPLPVGAGLQQARVIPRQGLQDLFVRWDVRRMGAVAGTPAGGLLYEIRFTSAGQHYAVRAQRVLGPDYDVAGGASFGLFRETLPGVWIHLASLKGGYGTVGDAVVTAVPLSLLGGKAQLTDVVAYTAVGSYLSGPTKVLDSLRLSR